LKMLVPSLPLKWCWRSGLSRARGVARIFSKARRRLPAAWRERCSQPSAASVLAKRMSYSSPIEGGAARLRAWGSPVPLGHGDGAEVAFRFAGENG
jgi:hypothetical protein